MVTEAGAFVCTKHKTIKVLFTLFDSLKKTSIQERGCFLLKMMEPPLVKNMLGRNTPRSQTFQIYRPNCGINFSKQISFHITFVTPPTFPPAPTHNLSPTTLTQNCNPQTSSCTLVSQIYYCVYQIHKSILHVCGGLPSPPPQTHNPFHRPQAIITTTPNLLPLLQCSGQGQIDFFSSTARSQHQSFHLALFIIRFPRPNLISLHFGFLN